ncbi:acetyl-CoA carboxylase biotin carboxyl carrier protein [bacterium]|nr:acetyl-CoA carboxylase biotin carboxyl carrier protein [bacterium]
MDIKELKKLIKLMKENELTEISVKAGDSYVSLKKGVAGNIVSMPHVVGAPQSSSQIFSSDEKDKMKRPANVIEITAPMVGTFYRAPSPDSDPYVEVGQTIQNGTVLCILEAMKLMNEVKSEISGRIVSILVENAEPVEFGQPLFWVEK